MSTDKFQRLADAIDGFISAEELKTLRDTEWGHGTFKEFTHAIQQAASKRLHPMRGHVYPRAQWLSNESREKLQLGVKIDGLRHIAERSGEYAGQTEPIWYDDEGNKHEIWLREDHPAAAVVEVLRHDFQAPMRGIARWDDYAPYKKNGELFHMWQNMGPHMLAKCAEANAHRKAFQVGDLYIEEEMHAERTQATPREKPPADAHDKTERDVEKVNEALGLGDGESGEGGEPEPALDPSAVESGDRTPGKKKGKEYQETAREATEQRAEENGAPERTISEKQENRLWAIAKEHGYDDTSLPRMVENEFGVGDTASITRDKYDRVVDRARDEQMAARYNRDPDTPNMFEEGSNGDPLPEFDADVSEAERSVLVEAQSKVERTLRQFDTHEKHVKHAAGFLQEVEGETAPRRKTVESAVLSFGVAPIPEGFPHRSYLTDAGLYTLQQVHDELRSGMLTGIEGIGDGRKGDIEVEIAHLDFDPLPEQPEANDDAFEEGVEDDAVPL